MDATVGGRRKTKRSVKSENVDPAAEPRATRSNIPVLNTRTGDRGSQQQEIKKSVGEIKKERDRESWRRHLSVQDKNRGESLTSAADLSDSVFADARLRPNSRFVHVYFIVRQVPSIIIGRLLFKTSAKSKPKQEGVFSNFSIQIPAHVAPSSPKQQW